MSDLVMMASVKVTRRSSWSDCGFDAVPRGLAIGAERGTVRAMKNLLLGASLLLAVCIVVLTYSHWLNKETDAAQPSSDDRAIDIDFKVTGTGSLPVESVRLAIDVKADAEGQIEAKQRCDAAAETMAKLIAGTPATRLDPKGITVDREFDAESKKSRIVVVRSFELVVDDVTKAEDTIGAVTRVEGCMIRSTEYRTSRLDEIRTMAIDDGKRKLDRSCADLVKRFAGTSYVVRNVRIDDEDRSGGFALFAAGDATGNENLQRAQNLKRIEAKLIFDVGISVRGAPAH